MARKVLRNLNWTQSLSQVHGKRYLMIHDVQETYYAGLPDGMTEREAVEQFVDTYDFNRDEPLEGEALEEARDELRQEVSWMLHDEPNAPDVEWDESGDEVGWYTKSGDFHSCRSSEN